ncbi:MAG: SDR family oxidoreductase [Phycisphaerae bacterium]|nr:SDR family oxidoreductase [Phycisphaerae bacterium]
MSVRPVALVTGGVRRVGLAIARALARSGSDLILTFRTNADEARAAATEIERLGGRASVERLDLDDLGAVEAFGARLAADLPRFDVLVHNASVYAPTPLATLDAAAMLSHFRINAAAPLLLTRHLAPRLRESSRPGGGAVVAIADMHALGRPRLGHAAYSMSKAALVEMVRVLARELAPRVRVNAVAPGVVAFPDSGPESSAEFQERYLARVPLARAGTPGDAAEAVRWLALDAPYVTGEVIRVDGGRWLA